MFKNHPFMTMLFSKKFFYIFLITFLLFGNVLKVEAQLLNSDSTISDGKIDWSHFTGQVDNSSKFWATIYWGVYYKYRTSYHGEVVKVDLQTWTVVRNKTWVKPDKKSDELLKHEQGHFNFAVLCELEFKKKVLATTLLRNDYSQKIDSIFKAILDKYREMEVEYDNETDHMMNRKKQELWNKKFEAMLQQ